MPRQKQKPRAPFERSPDGQYDERRTITVAHYWPDEGYGCGTSFKTIDAALAFARAEAESVETGNVRAEIHIVDTTVKTTVVRAA